MSDPDFHKMTGAQLTAWATVHIMGDESFHLGEHLFLKGEDEPFRPHADWSDAIRTFRTAEDRFDLHGLGFEHEDIGYTVATSTPRDLLRRTCSFAFVRISGVGG